MGIKTVHISPEHLHGEKMKSDQGRRSAHDQERKVVIPKSLASLHCSCSEYEYYEYTLEYEFKGKRCHCYSSAQVKKKKKKECYMIQLIIYFLGI